MTLSIAIADRLAAARAELAIATATATLARLAPILAEPELCARCGDTGPVASVHYVNPPDMFLCVACCRMAPGCERMRLAGLAPMVPDAIA